MLIVTANLPELSGIGRLWTANPRLDDFKGMSIHKYIKHDPMTQKQF